MKNRRNRINEQGIATFLTDAQLRKVIALEVARTQAVLANPMQWLPDDEILSLDPSLVPDLGFSGGLVRPGDLGFDISSFASHEDLEMDGLHNIAGKRGRGKGGNKGGGRGKPKGPQNLPSAQVVDQVVAQYMKGTTPAGNTGSLFLGEQNALFGSKQKAITYASSWKQILEPHHIMFWSEVDGDFVKELGQANGYGYWCSVANTRHQAVAIMAHPRLKKIGGPYSIDKVASVQGIPDLRPAYMVIFEDIWSGLIIRAIVVHLKSMMGGAKLTAPVRYQQCVEIVNYIGNAPSGVIAPHLKNLKVRNIWKNQIFGRGFTDHGTLTIEMPLCVLPEAERKLPLAERMKRAVTVIGGDWNMILGQVNDNQPITAAGYPLVNPTDNTSTQAHGGRLDGWHADKPNNPTCDADVKDESGEVTV